jgi:hypothetical protein
MIIRIEAFPVEAEVNSGWGVTVVLIMEAIPKKYSYLLMWHVATI